MSQEAYRIIIEYYKEILVLLQGQLEHAYITKEGRDISEILRGKILVLKDVINLKEYMEANAKEKKDE